jgi:hypothetical protein
MDKESDPVSPGPPEGQRHPGRASQTAAACDLEQHPVDARRQLRGELHKHQSPFSDSAEAAIVQECLWYAQQLSAQGKPEDKILSDIEHELIREYGAEEAWSIFLEVILGIQELLQPAEQAPSEEPTGPAPAGQPAEQALVAARPTLPVESWSELEIRFLQGSQESLEARVRGQRVRTFHYSELGLADVRKHKTGPRKAWVVLRTIAFLKGEFPYDDVSGAARPQPGRGRASTTNYEAIARTSAANKEQVRKRIQELRKIFWRHFGLPGQDPIPLVKEPGGHRVYKAQFRTASPPDTQL